MRVLVVTTLVVLLVQCVQCYFNNGEFKSALALLGCEERDVQHVMVSGRREERGLDLELKQGHVVDAVVRNVDLGESDVCNGWLKPLARDATCLRFQACRFGRGSLAALLQGVLQGRGSTAVKWLGLHHCAVDAASLNAALSQLKVGKGGADAADTPAASASASAAEEEDERATATGTLNVLDLSHNELDLASIQAVCRIVQRVPSVHTLALDMNPLPPSHVRALSQGLKKGSAASSLGTLSLSGCGLCDKSASSVVSLLKSQTTLTCLDLSSNVLGVDFMERLASALRKGVGQGLQELDLSYTSVGDGGCSVLTHALRSGHLPSLRSLKLRGIGATAKSLNALLAVVMDTDAAAATVLQCIDISGNDLFTSKKKKASGNNGAKAIPQKFLAAVKSLGLDEALKNSLDLSMSSFEAYGLVGGKEQKAKRYSRRSNSNYQRSLRALKNDAAFKALQNEDGTRRGQRVLEHRKVAINHDPSTKEDLARLQERHSIKVVAQLVVAMAAPEAAISLRDLQLNRVGLTPTHMARISQLVQKKLAGVERAEEGEVGNQRSPCVVSVRFNNLPPSAVEAMGELSIDIAF
jgi:hypothetical protein